MNNAQNKAAKRQKTRKQAERAGKRGKAEGRAETKFWQDEARDVNRMRVNSKNDAEDKKFYKNELKKDRQWSREQKRTGRSKLAIQKRDKRK